MKQSLRSAMDWIDQRTGFETGVRHFLYEDIPGSSGWHQVFGSVALFLFLVQAFSGVLLAFNFAPTPGEAYSSLKYIMTELTGGTIIRGLHHWGASLMVIVVGLHMIQVALYGAYKKPREATWILGVLLLLLVLAFGLTGYLLPWDNRAYWSTVVTTRIAGLAPGLGPSMVRFFGAEDGSIGVITYARFYGLHVMLLPPLTTLLMVLHVYLVRKHGVAPAPAETAPRKKFYPEQAFKDTVAIFVAFAALFVMAVAVEAPLGRLADPTDTTYVPRPDWYFLFLFQLLKFMEGPLEVVGAIILPSLAILALVLVPFIDRGKAKRLGERSLAAAVVALAIFGWTSLTVAAIVSTPEQPVIVAGEVETWTRLAPIELAGLAYYRQEGCGNCHNLLAGDPKMGPTLATISERKSAGWIIMHSQNPANVVPGSPMPPTDLNTQQLNSLAAFLLKLTPGNALGLEQTPNFAVDGARVYHENHCSNCHIINGSGMQVGPPLAGIGSRHPKEWLRKKIGNPDLARPETMMPVYDLAPDHLDLLASYLVALPDQ